MRRRGRRAGGDARRHVGTIVAVTPWGRPSTGCCVLGRARWSPTARWRWRRSTGRPSWALPGRLRRADVVAGGERRAAPGHEAEQARRLGEGVRRRVGASEAPNADRLRACRSTTTPSTASTARRSTSTTTRTRRSSSSTWPRSAGSPRSTRASRSCTSSTATRGFSVLGFPCNQFLGQEPGTPEEIATFCSTTYGVTFPLFEKIEVNGDDRHPLYDGADRGGRRRRHATATSSGTSRSSSSPRAAPVTRFRPHGRARGSTELVERHRGHPPGLT